MAIRKGKKEKFLLLSDIIIILQSYSNAKQLSLFQTVAESKSIRIFLKPQIENKLILSQPPRRALRSSKSSKNSIPNLKMIFIFYINQMFNDIDLQSLIKQIKGLDFFFRLELTRVYLFWSTLLTFSAIWQVWANFQGLPSFNFITKVFNKNLLLILAYSLFCQIGVSTAQMNFKELKSKNINSYQ